MGWGAGEGLHTLFENVAFLRFRSLRSYLTESHSPFICHRQRSCFLTLFEIVAFLRLRSLRLFLTESHSPFTCHRQRSSSILRSFERCPYPQTVIKDMYCHKFKATKLQILFLSSLIKIHKSSRFILKFNLNISYLPTGGRKHSELRSPSSFPLDPHLTRATL